jgi:hypothetical protein
LEAGFARCVALATEFMCRQSSFAYVDLHFGVESIIHDQAMRHPYSVGLHRVTCNIGIVAHVGIVEVRDFLWL